MSEPTRLRRALLELGLEDLIPLPEIATAAEITGVGEGIAVERLSSALIGLLREGRIQVWSGHWPRDPEVVDAAAAERLLRVEEHYQFNSQADERMRVYYVNVDNLRIGEDSG